MYGSAYSRQHIVTFRSEMPTRPKKPQSDGGVWYITLRQLRPNIPTISTLGAFFGGSSRFPTPNPACFLPSMLDIVKQPAAIVLFRGDYLLAAADTTHSGKCVCGHGGRTLHALQLDQRQRLP